MWGGVEAGGTKFVCVVGSGPDAIADEVRFPTTTPDDTLTQAIAFFQHYQEQHDPLQSIGIGSFGPVDLHTNSPTFGYITSTPKPGWAQTDIAGRISQALGIPVHFDTDVNAAALGEHRWGSAQGLDTFVYLTVGTGIGGGGLINGKPAHGLLHPELGHMSLPHDIQTDPFPGMCPFHGDCLEGLASGPAIEKRWGRAGDTLAADHPAWPLEADYLAFGLTNVIYTLSPQRIIIGGGVMQQAQLFPLIRRKVQALINGYVNDPAILDEIEDYIVPPALGNRAGVLGALALAQQAE
jgi:fructokinase